MKISNVMERDVKTCTPDDTLESVALAMWNSDCGSIAVTDPMGRPVGIITDRDITMSCALNHRSLWDLRVRDVTNNRPLYTCMDDDDVKIALEIMQTRRIRRLPVVDDAGRLQGILSIDDLVAASEEKKSDITFRDTMSTLKAVCIHH